MSTDVSGLGVSRLLLVGALALAPVIQAGAASAVTLAFYDSYADSALGVIGARTVDGEPVGTDAVRGVANVFGGDNYQELIVEDADGNEVSPDGIAAVDIFSGSLFDAGYDVYMTSHLFVYGVDFFFENVSDETLFATLRLDRFAEAEAFSTVSTATSFAGADNLGADLYFDTAAEDWRPEDRMSPEAIDALSSDFSVYVSSDDETSATVRVTRDFEVLLYPGDTFYVDYFFLPAGGGLENTPVAPVPLPAGAPLLLAALGGLAVARRWRNPAR